MKVYCGLILFCLWMFTAFPAWAQEENTKTEATVVNPEVKTPGTAVFYGNSVQGKTLRLEAIPPSNGKLPSRESRSWNESMDEEYEGTYRRQHGFLDVTSLFILGGYLLGFIAIVGVAVFAFKKFKSK